MNKTKFIVGISSFLILLILIIGCAKNPIPTELQEKIISGDTKTEEKLIPSETPATPPMKIEISLSRAPALGETAEVIAIINYTGKIKENMPETTASIILPDGFEVISGNSTWTGYLKREPTQFSITVKAVQTGNWTIEAKARNEWFGGFDYVYVSVLEDKGLISKESFPLPKREDSDRAIKMDESEIPPETEPPPNKNITTPKPTEAHVRMFNLTPSFYVLEMANMTTDNIINDVSNLINATK